MILRVPVFKNKDLTLVTKRAVYRTVVLAVLLYGAETWTMKAVHTRHLNSFHNRCIRTILGVTRYQQWNERLTSQSLSHRFGLQHSISDIILEQCLKWLGHVGCMDEERLPNRLWRGELNMKRPCHGAKKRWRDVLKVDLQAIGVYDRWYELCQDRKGWFHLCLDGVEKISTSRRWNTCSANKQSELRTVSCACGRKFRRQGDLTRYQHFCVMPS